MMPRVSWSSLWNNLVRAKNNQEERGAHIHFSPIRTNTKAVVRVVDWRNLTELMLVA